VCPAKGIEMSQKIYVGNLNYSTTEDALSNAFSQYGEILSAVVIKDRYTDQSKGFGFIEMTDSDAANAAITALNGQEIDGRRVRVNLAEDKPRDSRPPRRGPGGPREGGGGGGYHNRY
jgi:RNA recognition motif-containing protein